MTTESNVEGQFVIAYWGTGWNLQDKAFTPRICQNDAIADTWRGRFENAQITLRMCAAEGNGFKRHIPWFLMLSAYATVSYHLPTFYKWCVAQGKKVMTERVVIGTMLEVHSETVRGSECGVAVENWANSWKTSLKNVARQFHTEAMKSGGQFAALVLDPDGRMLDVAQMLQHKGKNSISHLLILLGGPGGISQADSDDLLADSA